MAYYIGKEIIHRGKFGKGRIIGQNQKQISVRFYSSNEIRQFNYPECFNHLLELNATYSSVSGSRTKTEENISDSLEREIEQKIRKEEISLKQESNNPRAKRSGKMPDVVLYSSVDDFCLSQENLLIREIAYLRANGGKRIKISDGKLVEFKEGRYIYSFESETELGMPDNTQITLWLHGISEGIPAVIINCEDFNVIIASSESIGNNISIIEFSAEPWRLLNYLIQRLRKLKENPNPIAKELICDGRKMIHPKAAMAKGQDVAAKMSLSQSITFVWGPPGTGKTNTLARIAISHVASKGRVLMLSYSNVSVDEAVKRVYKRDPGAEPGKFIRYGYPKDKELLDHDFLTSYNLVLKKHPDLLKERKTLIKEREHLSRSTSRYVEIGQRLSRIRQEIDEEEKAAVDNAKFVATTVSKAIADKTIYESEFDTVIFDEASMAYIPQVVFSAGLAKKHFICMGDFAQLPPIVQSDNANSLNADIFRYCGIIEAVEHGCGHEWLCMLDTQYRMHPDIADFSSRTMYQNLLKSAPNIKKEREDIVSSEPFSENPLYLADLSGMLSVCTKTADNSRINILSALISIGLAIKAARNHEAGVIAPYSSQSRLLHSMARDATEQCAGIKKISCATVHQFQGSEKDVIIYDAVDCYRMPFPGTLITSKSNNYANRLYNVALTRARGKMISVVNADYMRNKNLSNDLIFRTMIDELTRSKKYVKGEKIFNEIDSDLVRCYDLNDAEKAFIKDIDSAKKEIVIDIPEATDAGREFCLQLKNNIAKAKTRKVIVSIRTNDKANMPPELRDLVIENKYITNPVSVIDKNITWYGMPSSDADFISEDTRIPTLYKPMIRFKGQYFAQNVYALMEMNRISDLPDVNVETKGDLGKYSSFSSYVSGEIKCSKCGHPMQLKKNKNGRFFVGCSNYPNCTNTEFVDVDMVEDYFYLYEKYGKKCPKCNKSLEAKKGPYGVYVSCCGAKKHIYKLDEV